MKLRSSCCANCSACSFPTAHPHHLLTVLLILCAFSLSRIHSKVIHRRQDVSQPGLSVSEEHQEAVAELKHRIQRHARLQGLPVADHQVTTVHNSTIRKKIREFMRSLRGDDEEFADDADQEPRKFIFHSSGSVLELDCSDVTVLKLDCSGVTVLEVDCFGVTVLELDCSAVTVLEVDCSGVTVLVLDCSGVTVLELDCSGVTVLELDCSGVTVLELDCSGVTVLVLDCSGFTVLELDCSGVTVLELDCSGVTFFFLPFFQECLG
ncbi:hypothetical protein Btru_010379 [Bulinus truncatus]|nr:hypothetical protein Btru_010379 [Bulinus truncatus]